MVEADIAKDSFILPSPKTKRGARVQTFALSQTGKYLLFAVRDVVIARRQQALGGTAPSTVELGFKGMVTCIKFMYDTNTVAVGEDNGAVNICKFDEATGKFTLEQRRQLLTGEIKDIAFMHVKKPKIIATGEGSQCYVKCVNSMGMEHGIIAGP